ncbi:hypothetical protein [Crocinitomix catalasitica]|uniref:hypothetical protein n=1 Tax=Crocinitomix catalasitica TaxID=184607 RepID=UPI0012FC237F|nr:hypothetical protein [Crocinitomix catalasitica]
MMKIYNNEESATNKTLKMPKKSTIDTILAFSKSFEVLNSKNEEFDVNVKQVEILLN